MPNDVYMHGQVLGTHCFRLRGGFLQPDEYSEIEEKTFLPGGETYQVFRPPSANEGRARSDNA